ncbi:unnamed protein product [Ambrosiozyma monospora]|uniref:Unnamed protein product n=1 Tax=Ambrosiozyma monospora TaxID=43982 RepID=A0ACB5T3I3_AMBMO|nr:unnamed protein product [Ambrosiozyma monospora]
MVLLQALLSVPLEIPIAQQQQHPTLTPQQREQRRLARPPGSALHVLLVEDDEVCIQLCSKFLMKYGCTVQVVKDGLAAISVVEAVKFDLVLMDIVMPNLDGASATKIIRNFDKDTPIIAMTGNYQHDDLLTYLNHGMTDILAKPFGKEDLYQILEKHQMDKKLIHPPGDIPLSMRQVSNAGSSATPAPSATTAQAQTSPSAIQQQQQQQLQSPPTIQQQLQQQQQLATPTQPAPVVSTPGSAGSNSSQHQQQQQAQDIDYVSGNKRPRYM